MNDRIAELLRSAWQLRDSEQFDRMLELAGEAKRLSEETGFTPGIPRAIAIEAFVHYIRSDFRAALAECIRALRLSQGDAEAESRTRSVLAMVHWSLGNYEEALRNSDESIRLLEVVGDRVTEAFAYAVKGGILLSMGQLEQALEWHQRSIEGFKAAAWDTVGQARALSGLGLTYLAQKRYDDALSALLEALQLAKRGNHRITVSRTLNDLGEVFEALGNDTQALRYHNEALEVRQREGYRQAETTSLLALGRIYVRAGEYAKAIELLERGLNIADDIGIRPRIAQFHHALADVYQRMAQLAPALQHFMEWEKIKSELAVDQAALRYKAIVLESQLQTVQRDAEMEILASLGSLVGAIAHEINSPLGAIQSSANVAVRAAEKLLKGHDPKAAGVLRDNAQVIAEASRRMADFVTRLKVFAGVDQARYVQVDLVRAVEDTIALLKPEFDQRVDVSFEHERVPMIYAYATELYQVFLNLLRNAIEAIEGAGKVSIRLAAKPDFIEIAFQDTGRGIPADVLPNLFAPGFSTGSGRVRASLSLFTCMAILKKHGGDIHVKSELGNGSTFTVLLPRSLERADAQLERGEVV